MIKDLLVTKVSKVILVLLDRHLKVVKKEHKVTRLKDLKGTQVSKTQDLRDLQVLHLKDLKVLKVPKDLRVPKDLLEHPVRVQEDLRVILQNDLLEVKDLQTQDLQDHNKTKELKGI